MNHFRGRRRLSSFLALAAVLALPAAFADWPTLRGNPQRTGFTPTPLLPPYRLAWAAEFADERLGTALEPIVAQGRVFIATHHGNLYALDATSGEPLWRFASPTPFLHSPTTAPDVLVAADATGGLFALDTANGHPRWTVQLDAEPDLASAGGCSASPLIAEHLVCVGTRGGWLIARDLNTGAPRWHHRVGAPIRQTAALAGHRLIVTAEDLVVRAFDLRSGVPLWASAPLHGQTARDYYPVIVETPGRTLVVVRTNPTRNMADRIARDRSLLARHAGANDRDWRELEAWTRSDAARGTPELWTREQAAVTAALREQPEAQTFFIIDAATGQSLDPPPILWAAGCQGVGTAPTLTADGRLLVFHRSAYGNWNRGVAPLVALGLLNLHPTDLPPPSQHLNLDLPPGPFALEPLFHAHGPQPPWNTFWGTADESQNFVVADRTALIVHQGTLSAFDLNSHQLTLLHGNRDSYGGFPNPAWARNEWHGPARGGVAVDGPRLYWITGSRVLCLESQTPPGEAASSPARPPASPTEPAPKQPRSIRAGSLPASSRPHPPACPARTQAARTLADLVTECLDHRWAPLLVEPGLAGREFFFTHSGETFEALAWAYPHLDPTLQARLRTWLSREWEQHPPFSSRTVYPLNDGKRREVFPVAPDQLARLGHDRPPHPFGNLPAIVLCAERVGERERVLAAWPELQACFADWQQLRWRLDGTRGDLHANRYLAALLAFADLAHAAHDPALAETARNLAETTTAELVNWWRRAAREGTLTRFQDTRQLDPFIGSGDALSFKIVPHRHKIALFRDLTPAVATRLQTAAPDAVATVWTTFRQLCPTWWLIGEERQIHFGENFVDPPDFALGAFRVLRWLPPAPAAELARRVDLPWCRADLYHVLKLAWWLEAEPAPAPVPKP
ncbi:MAG: PQQ-like beta-propeller repeat protein [Verrucomicrobiales bacterium]|nr:PQQ-like beta-propeller repeat protein [Verrucomicrobiales bacterium]